MLNFGALPPEVNSAKMYAGAGSGSLLAAAAAWNAVAAEMRSAAINYESVIRSLVSEGWLGPSSAKMSAAVAPYLEWLNTTAVQAEQAGAQASTAAAAYEAAFAATVPPPVVAANRTLMANLVASNIFGQNTGAIAATDAQYGEMWAEDASAMTSYTTASRAASQMTPFSSTAVRHHHRRNGPAEQRGPGRHRRRRGRSGRHVGKQPARLAWSVAQFEYLYHRACRDHELLQQFQPESDGGFPQQRVGLRRLERVHYQRNSEPDDVRRFADGAQRPERGRRKHRWAGGSGRRAGQWRVIRVSDEACPARRRRRQWDRRAWWGRYRFRRLGPAAGQRSARLRPRLRSGRGRITALVPPPRW